MLFRLRGLQRHSRSETARDAYLALHDMQDLPNDLGGFLKFYDHRRGLMAARLGELLGVSTPNPEA